ncbi:MAG: TIGR03620 family F420-dependent LLM class oxidoreductase [Pseudomonadota bacterium]
MNLGQLGVWYAADKLSPEQWIDFIGHIEQQGYGALWHSEAMGYEAMSFGAFLLSHTTSLTIGTAIANIYARDAVAARNGLNTLSRISGGRYVLGLGVSHIPMVERFRGHHYGKPVATMRQYLEAIREGQDDPADLQVMIAALGPRMLDLSAELSRGAIPYNVTPEHTAMARERVGPKAILVVEQKVCMETDDSVAHEWAKRELSRYMPLPNYRNNWLRLGFSENELADGGNRRFLNAMVAWGDRKAIEARINAHRQAGATHVCIQPVTAEGDLENAKHMLSELAGI